MLLGMINRQLSQMIALGLASVFRMHMGSSCGSFLQVSYPGRDPL
jgi:hypothetical protein